MLKAETIEILESLSSIRTIGPKAIDEEVLMELPNRKQLRDMIIQRVKGRRVDDAQNKQLVSSKYALKRVYNTLVPKSHPGYIAKEWAELIDKEDERHAKLFYEPVGAKRAWAPNVVRPVYETMIEEPKSKQTKEKYDSLDYVIVETNSLDLSL